MIGRFKKNLKNKISCLFIEDEPSSYDEWFTAVSMYCSMNIENIENLRSKYQIYLDVFKEYKNGPKPVKKPNFGALTTIGIFSRTNLSFRYWSDRGYDREHYESFIKERQNINSVNSIMKRTKVSEAEAKDALRSVFDKYRKTYYANPNLKEINHAKGKSARISHYLEQINPETNENYKLEEIKSLFSKRFGWRLGQIYTDKDKMTNNACVEYYLAKGFSQEEAEKRRSERQNTYSLNKCIEKFGHKQGIIKWKERQTKWQNTLNSKSEEEKIEINRKRVQRSNFYSVESIKFFDRLIDRIKSEINDDSLRIFYKDNEYYIHDGKKFHQYDFAIKELMLIIEYNGSHVHPNKNRMTLEQWSKWKNPFNKDSADVAYKKEKIKLNAAKRNGFKVLIVWDFEDKKKKLDDLMIQIKNRYKQYIKNKI